MAAGVHVVRPLFGTPQRGNPAAAAAGRSPAGLHYPGARGADHSSSTAVTVDASALRERKQHRLPTPCRLGVSKAEGNQRGSQAGQELA